MPGFATKLERPVPPAAAEIERMKVGVPREIKSDEYRVAMLPVGALELTNAGHMVLVEPQTSLEPDQ
jgi:Alanine dehydrogenase/PNT, N-terminal domain